MSNVVDLHQPDPKAWICDCGCMTFVVLSDGTFECANCQVISAPDHGGWSDIMQGGLSDKDSAEAFMTVHGGDSVEFTKARLKRLASDDDVECIAVIKSTSKVHVWSAAETQEQVEWTHRRLDDAKDVVAPKPDSTN